MNEGGVKAWDPHRVQNPLAFSDEEEEDLLDFMYKFKAPRRTELPLEVHGVWGCEVGGGRGSMHLAPDTSCMSGADRSERWTETLGGGCSTAGQGKSPY